MGIKRVWTEEGCIACHVSADTCPAVFDFPDHSEVSIVKEGVDLSQHEAEIREAAEMCPVGVIKFEED